jgi:cytochrome c oxidase subunit 1/cytochrome c oxidase subunit I+III
MSERVLDVSKLPAVASGPRATIWWGVLGLLAIEGAMFGLLVATYFYLQRNFQSWPPPGTPAPDLAAGTANMALLLVSLWLMRTAQRAALEERRRPIWIALAICIVIGAASLALRALEFNAMHCRWDTHAYGSVVWTTLGMHTGHLIASTLENVLLALLMLRGPVERKHFVDVNVNAVYWYFVVIGWLPIYMILYFSPRLL